MRVVTIDVDVTVGAVATSVLGLRKGAQDLVVLLELWSTTSPANETNIPTII